MSVLDMKLSDDLAEAIGQVAINAIMESDLSNTVVPVTEDGWPADEPSTTVWTANAAEQIGRTVMERFDISFKVTHDHNAANRSGPDHP